METALKVRGVDASYYSVKDLDKTTKFYTDLLGVDPETKTDFFSEWTLDDDSSFGLYTGEMQGRSGTVMFAVDDVDAAIARVKSLGALQQHENNDSLELPVCTMIFGSDPEGNTFMFHKRK